MSQVRPTSPSFFVGSSYPQQRHAPIDPFSLPGVYNEDTFGGRRGGPTPASNDGFIKRGLKGIWTALKYTAGIGLSIITFRYLRKQPRVQELYNKLPSAEAIKTFASNAFKQFTGLFAEGSTLRKMAAATPQTIQDVATTIKNLATSAYTSVSNLFRKAPSNNATPFSSNTTGTVV